MRIQPLPAPFEWVAIPDGSVLLEAGGYIPAPAAFAVPPFSIARYPVTNAQYAMFIEAGGYERREWWDGDG